MVSPHDVKTIYQASHVLHRSTDDGVTWQVISPDLTAHEKAYQVVPGGPITRDVTGEEVYSSIYSMDESPLERGVIWIGANDGPVHVTRDGGKTWKNVTPPDLPPGGRVQNIDASHIRKGSAYIAVYRYLREHDLKPYIYRTDDYGATWTKLTDGTNGIPVDHPTRVVREDPERAGLLYAGTEFGIFVSFDNGSRWQPLQQNLPATPVTDIRVHRGDLVIATMGRSFWIMDDIAPLRQMAASGRQLTLLRPSSRIRYRRAGGGRGAAPQYPPVALAIDYVLPEGFSGPLTLTIADAQGRMVRTVDRRQRAGEGRGAAPQPSDARAGGSRHGARCRPWARRQCAAHDTGRAQPLHVGLPLVEQRPAGRAREIPCVACAGRRIGPAAPVPPNSRCRSIPACFATARPWRIWSSSRISSSACATRSRTRPGCGHRPCRRWRRPTSSRHGHRARASRSTPSTTPTRCSASGRAWSPRRGSTSRGC